MDRFRDLERAGQTGRKDAALLAAISGFEALKQPTSQDLRQFSNLFAGLFELTREDTRRTAAAALSKLPRLPQDVTLMVADQPIRISAPFLALSPCLNDQLLLQILARHGIVHARAISRRETLSPIMISALSSLDDEAVSRSLRLRHNTGSSGTADLLASNEAARRYNEDVLRNRIKDLALRRINNQSHSTGNNAATGRPDLRKLIQTAESSLPVRFAQLLSRALGAQHSLAERIMLDLSGRQLTMALFALGMHDDDIRRVLIGIFPQLRRTSEGVRLAELLISSTDRKDSIERVMAWVRANPIAASDQRVRYQPQTQPRDDKAERKEHAVRQVAEPAKDVKRA
ncbi:hypothetical protein [Hoeflea poritis]|uniref:DUF2336 domain-containing protein n=1 Tax=Hoeflea poritis TaxID=2993659 RepID=A0ABT4VU49_9HYPH|nr:hypothetical protein [Hoeflea poritis]MDA4848139.1 hypothetical protein [Hoeflea poritis]